MMFKGYKTTTKDIDLVFKTEKDRDIFIKAIERLGYKQRTLKMIYDEKRRGHTRTPMMFTRGEERFDLFVKEVFGFKVSFDDDELEQRIDFIGKEELTIKILSKEQLILLKAITGRDRDYEDIETIVNTEKDINWRWLVKEAIKQKKSNSWILIDLEETLQRLRKKIFIKEEILDRIYKAQE